MGTAAAIMKGIQFIGTVIAAGKAIDSIVNPPKAPELPEMPDPAPQKEAPDQYNRMREQQRRDRLRRGLAATIRTGGMGDTTLANLSAPSLLGGTQKTLLGQ